MTLRIPEKSASVLLLVLVKKCRECELEAGARKQNVFGRGFTPTLHLLTRHWYAFGLTPHIDNSCRSALDDRKPANESDIL